MPDKTKRPKADSVGHIHTELLPETIAMIQKTIVDLEVELRLRENECDFLNEKIATEKDALACAIVDTDREYYVNEVRRATDRLEEAERECDELERKQLYYKQQLDSESILPIN